jgi:deoxyadenosine/deoxycytidine kinase
MNYFVAIAGNIGVGKSTLTGLLAARLGWEAFYEAVDENPYLADFYADMPRWSFHSQAFFLARRLQQHALLLRRADPVLQDRSVYEDAEVFARTLYAQGHMAERDWQTYYDLFTTLAGVLTPPNLIVYLRASVPTLQARIAARGRAYERGIPADYLAALNGLYEAWVARFTLCPVLTVDTDAVNFPRDPAALDQVARRILERLPRQEAFEFIKQ